MRISEIPRGGISTCGVWELMKESPPIWNREYIVANSLLITGMLVLKSIVGFVF
jgi:hypothetical protein